jgi:hypothetical protein
MKRLLMAQIATAIRVRLFNNHAILRQRIRRNKRVQMLTAAVERQLSDERLSVRLLGTA